MGSPKAKKRPDCEQILGKKKLWAIDFNYLQNSENQLNELKSRNKNFLSTFIQKKWAADSLSRPSPPKRRSTVT